MSRKLRQVDLMRQLVATRGRRPEIVCPIYARAEREGVVQRRSNTHDIDPEQYAMMLYGDGDRKGWF